MRIVLLFLLIFTCVIVFAQVDTESDQDRIVDEHARHVQGNIPLSVDQLLWRSAQAISEYETKMTNKYRVAIDEICKHLIWEDKEKELKDLDGGEIGMIILKGGINAVTGLIDKYGGIVESVLSVPLDIYSELNRIKAENAKIRAENEKIRNINGLLDLWDDMTKEFLLRDEKSTSIGIYKLLTKEYQALSEEAKSQMISGPVEGYIERLHKEINELDKFPIQEIIEFEILKSIYIEYGKEGKAGLNVTIDYTSCGLIENVNFNDQVCLPQLDFDVKYKLHAPGMSKLWYFKREFEEVLKKTGMSYDHLDVHKYYFLKFKSDIEPMCCDAVIKYMGRNMAIGIQEPELKIYIRRLDQLRPRFGFKYPFSITPHVKNDKGMEYEDIIDRILKYYMNHLKQLKSI